MTRFHSHNLYEVWDQVPVTYYQDGVRNNILQRIWHGKKVKTAASLLKRYSFRNLLDAGCASGYMAHQVSLSFPKKLIYGVDVYDKAVKYAKQTYPNIRFRVANIEKIPYKTGSFDAIMCFEVIEHVERPFKVLRELRRVLTKDGRLILAMDSGNWLFRIVWKIWEHTRGRAWRHAHLHPFTHKELEALIKKSGFKIIEKKFTHWSMEVVFVLTK